MERDEVLKHYSSPEVRREIFDYSFGRWMAVHVVFSRGTAFQRYFRGSERPLAFRSYSEFAGWLDRRSAGVPRTFYASVNVYKTLRTKEDPEKPENIIRSTPIWDIDGSLNHVDEILEAARIIVDFLEREGIVKSVYLIWSGRGVHVQINERAFSEDVLSKHHPLDIAYAIVDYSLKKLRDRLAEVAKRARDPERPLKVENEIDLKRVFTAPLSLHKSEDLVAVCFKPEDIDSFSLDWAKPFSFRHSRDWRKYEAGEADELALKAIKEVGGYFERTGEIRTVVGSEPERVVRKVARRVRAGGKIGRFQVMALLQAARYYLLTGDVEKAKSFGLNRAIFYAWAKHHGRTRAIIAKARRGAKPVEVQEVEGKKAVRVGNEVAFISDRGWFIMGDKEQRPEDFDRNVRDKIEQVVPFDVAWQAALEYLRKMPREVLLDQQKFFEAYKRVRDDFVEKVIEGKGPKESTLESFFKGGKREG